MVFDAYDTVQAGPLHGVNPLRMAVSLIKLLIGVLQSLGLMARHRPGAVFLTGGWVGVPVAMAAALFRVPIVIFVPDIEPGLTLKVLGRFAKIVTATTEDTRQYYPAGKTVVATGYPLREDLQAATREAGLTRFGLASDALTLLVFGGSRGARSINQAMLACAQDLLNKLPALQVIHVTGTLDWDDIKTQHAKFPSDIQARYHIFDYLHDMGLAMAAADGVVSRAGASTLGEFPYFQLPAILIPYPYAWRYQRVNAEWLVERGAAWTLADEDMQKALLPMIVDLMGSDQKRIAMQQAMASLAVKDGAERIAQVILKEGKP